MTKRKQTTKKTVREYFWLLLLATLFVGSILWSIGAETVAPLLRAGDTRGVWLHGVGLPLILLGTAVFVYGGFVFVRDTFSAFQNETLQKNRQALHNQQATWEMRRENARILFRAWVPGLRWMGLGALALAAGGFIIDL